MVMKFNVLEFMPAVQRRSQGVFRPLVSWNACIVVLGKLCSLLRRGVECKASSTSNSRSSSSSSGSSGVVVYKTFFFYLDVLLGKSKDGAFPVCRIRRII